MKRVWMSAAAVLLMLALSAALVTPAWAEGCAPVAQNLELKTYRNTTVERSRPMTRTATLPAMRSRRSRSRER